MEKINTIIFDFDGTIADSFEQSIEIIYELSKKTNLDLTKEKIIDYIKNKELKKIIKEFNINKLKLLYYIWKIKREFKKRVNNVKPFPKIKNIIFQLSKKYDLIIVSNNDKKTIQDFLEKYEINYFNEIYQTSLFGKTKTINQIIKNHKLHKKDVIYIGDETKDITASKKANIKILSVTYGFNSKKLIQKHRPNYMVDSCEEIIEILK